MANSLDGQQNPFINYGTSQENVGDPANPIMPFGKYQGRLVAEVMLEDPQYLQWCTGQNWFRERNVQIYQFIINRGAAPEDTPEPTPCKPTFSKTSTARNFSKACSRILKSKPDKCWRKSGYTT